MLRFTIRQVSPIPIDVSAVLPERIRSLGRAGAERIPVRIGNREVPVSDLFEVAGDVDDGVIEWVGDCSAVRNIGRGMSTGTIRVHGPAGMHVGAEMTGGLIEIYGNVDDYLGAEMRNGMIRVSGNTADHVGSAYPGSPKGQRGGAILIDGSAGHELGAGMRRGLIAVSGAIGQFAGCGMIAGTIMAGDGFGIRAGAGMKRGTLVSGRSGMEMLPTFRPSGEFVPVFLAVYLRRLRQIGFPAPSGLEHRRFRRYNGDEVSLGKGEILVPL